MTTEVLSCGALALSALSIGLNGLLAGVLVAGFREVKAAARRAGQRSSEAECERQLSRRFTALEAMLREELGPTTRPDVIPVRVRAEGERPSAA